MGYRSDKDMGNEVNHLGGFRPTRPRFGARLGYVPEGPRLSNRDLVLNQISAPPWGQLPYMPSAGFMQRPYWMHTRYPRAIHRKRG